MLKLIAVAACTFGLLVAASASAAEHVLHISVDGLRPDLLQTLIDGGQAPNFKRFQTEGAWTTNARTDYTHTITLPNHTSMVTGRPVSQPTGMANTVHHGWTLNTDPAPTATLHNSGNIKAPYKASTWDVAHDAGLKTALYASKSKFIIYEQSYNAASGAAHANGKDKIDVTRIDESSTVMQNLLLADLVANRPNYSFIHYADADDAGHSTGWGTTAWNNAVKKIDGFLGQLFTLVQTDEVLAGRTAIVLSADHGGNGTGHGTATQATNYTIPFFAWGVGVAPGDIYAMNSAVRTNPGTSRPNYNAAAQPIRNGDGGNLALSLLGLGPIPGSLINASQNLRVAMPADFNGDSTVDGDDLAAWKSGCGTTGNARREQGDADDDRDVDGSDFLIWQRAYVAAAATTAVPEPASWSLCAIPLVTAFAAMAGRGRRHLKRA